MRGGLTLDRRIECEDQLVAWFQPANEPFNVEVVGADPVQRGQGSTKHVIAAAEGPRALQGPQVGKIFDDADRALVTSRVAAYRTGLERI